MPSTYYEKRWCDDCLTVHWLEVTPNQKEICHGENFTPANTITHYMRKSGKGFEMVEKMQYRKPLTTDWQIVAEGSEYLKTVQEQDF
jgi:hypothetical protein